MKQKQYPLYNVPPLESFKEVLFAHKHDIGDKLAYRYKVPGDSTVCDVTWSDFADDVEELGAGLTVLGFNDKHVAIVSENSYRWIATLYTMLCCDGTAVPVDKDLPQADMVNIINEGDVDAVFYSDKLAEKVLGAIDKTPRVKLFVSMNDTEECGEAGCEEYPKFATFSSVKAAGREALDSGDDRFARQENGINDMKLLVYTSGTTGLAKGVMLSKGNIEGCVYNGQKMSMMFDMNLSILPYHHTYELVCDILVAAHKGTTVCINESLKAISTNIKLYKPDLIMVVPRVLEVLYNRIITEIRRQGKEKTFNRMVKVSNGLRAVGIDRRRVFFKSILDSFGGNMRKLVSGGAPLRPELGRFFEDIGIDVINAYGITECSPGVAINRDRFNDPSTVGCPIPCIEVRIDDPAEDGTGEICVKGKTVMLGYYKNPRATSEAIQDGWFHTGDYGYMNDAGQLVITGRKKNIIVLSNGKNIYPEELEGYIEQSDYVKEVVVYGVRNDSGEEVSLCAEIYPDKDVLHAAGIMDGEAEKALLAECRRLCGQLPAYKQIKYVVVRPAEFEKTTTVKIKRSSVIGL